MCVHSLELWIIDKKEQAAGYVPLASSQFKYNLLYVFCLAPPTLVGFIIDENTHSMAL